MMNKNFLDIFKEQNDDYWIKKNNVPRSLYQAIKPYFDKDLAVLDLGCAGARLSRSMRNHFKLIYAIDKSESLITRSSLINPDINFICGDFGDPRTWKLMNQRFDLIVSDCAVRKDYVDLKILLDRCRDNLNKDGKIILRIQGINDLGNILNKDYRSTIFYSEKELKELTSIFKDAKIQTESYTQKFSNEQYLQDFLRKIDIDQDYSDNINVIRQYYLITLHLSLE